MQFVAQSSCLLSAGLTGNLFEPGVMTDGEETCGGVLATARDRALAAGVRIVVIAFDIDDRALLGPLQELAESTGGTFFEANDPTQLGSALDVSIRRLRYLVLDEEGAHAAVGAIDGARLELPTGTYQLALPGSPPQVVGTFRMAPLQRTAALLRVGADGFVVDLHGPGPP
jgi:hypothetical protein